MPLAATAQGLVVSMPDDDSYKLPLEHPLTSHASLLDKEVLFLPQDLLEQQPLEWLKVFDLVLAIIIGALLVRISHACYFGALGNFSNFRYFQTTQRRALHQRPDELHPHLHCRGCHLNLVIVVRP